MYNSVSIFHLKKMSQCKFVWLDSSADYPQCVAISCVVKCGKGMVTWFSTSANHMHSAWTFLHFTFRILQFCILPEPVYYTSNDSIAYLFVSFVKWHEMQIADGMFVRFWISMSVCWIKITIIQCAGWFVRC